MSTEIPLPTGSYVTNDPRGSSKRLVGCFSEALDTTSRTDSKAHAPAIMLRRQPGTAVFGSVAAAVAAIVAQAHSVGSGITAGQPTSSASLSVTAGGLIVDNALETVGIATYGPEVTTAALTSTATQVMSPGSSNNSGVDTYQGCFGYYNGETGQAFNACGSVGTSVLATAGATAYLGTLAQAYTTNPDPTVTTGGFEPSGEVAGATVLQVAGQIVQEDLSSLQVVLAGDVSMSAFATLNYNGTNYPVSDINEDESGFNGTNTVWSWNVYASAIVQTGTVVATILDSGSNVLWSAIITVGSFETHNTADVSFTITAGDWYTDASNNYFIGYSAIETAGSISDSALDNTGNYTVNGVYSQQYSAGTVVLQVNAASSPGSSAFTNIAISGPGVSFSKPSSDFSYSFGDGIATWSYGELADIVYGDTYTVTITGGTDFGNTYTTYGYSAPSFNDVGSYVFDGGYAFGYNDSNETYEGLSSFGSINSGAIGLIGTVNFVGVYAAPGPTLKAVVTITHSGGAPTQNSFSAVSWTDTNGSQEYLTSAASYSTSGNTATWQWSYDGTFGEASTPFLDTTTVFTFDSALTGYNEYFVLQLTGASAPAQDIFGAVSWTDNNGAHSLSSTGDSVTYSTSGDTSTWQWPYDYGTYSTSPFSSSTTFSFTGVFTAIGFDTGESGLGLSDGGECADDVVGLLGTVISAAYVYNPSTATWDFEVAINGGSVSAPSKASITTIYDGTADTWSTSGSSYSVGEVSSDYIAYWNWNGAGRPSSSPWAATDEYGTVFTIEGGPTGYDDGTSAGGEALPAIGSVNTTTIGGNLTLNAAYYYYDEVNNETYFEVIATGAVQATQTGITSVTVNGGTPFLQTGVTMFRNVGNAGIWLWSVGSGSIIPITVGGAPYAMDFQVLVNYTGYDDGTEAGGDRIGDHATGSVTTSPNPLVLTGSAQHVTINSAAYTYYDGDIHFQVIASGASTAPASDAFASVSWTDTNPITSQPWAHTLNTDFVYSYTTASKAAVWDWIVTPDVAAPAFGFVIGSTYSMALALTSQPWCGYDDGTTTYGEGSSFGSLSGAVPFGAFNAIEFTAVPDTVTTTTARATGLPQSSAPELVGTGNDSATNFTYDTAETPVSPFSVVITAGTVVATDNGSGNLTGTGVSSGTIDYTTGAISITYSTHPATGVKIQVTYQYIPAAPAGGGSSTVVTQLHVVASGLIVDDVQLPAPTQYAFTSIQFENNLGTTVTFETADATYVPPDADNPYAAEWIWNVSQGNSAIADFFVSGDSYAFTFYLPDFSGYDDGTGASGSGFSAFGGGPGSTPDDHTPVAPITIGTVNAIELTSVPFGAGYKNTLLLAVTPDADEFPAGFTQSDLVSLAFANLNGQTVILQGADAVFYTNGDVPATATGIWQWTIGTTGTNPPAQEFMSGNQYSFNLHFAGPAAVDSVRGMHQMQGVLYAVVGPTLYTVDKEGNFAQISTGLPGKLATGIGGLGQVRMADNTNNLVILIPNTNIAYTYCPGDTTGAPTFQQLSSPGFTEYGAIDVWYCQGYFCFLMTNGRGFFNDDGLGNNTTIVNGVVTVNPNQTGQITFNEGNVFGRENGTDLLVGMAVDHLEVMCFGTLTSEGFQNAGVSPGDPFQASPSTFMEQGCDPAAGLSVAKQDQTIFWVANDRTVRRRVGQTPQRVSNSGIEAILEDANLTGCYALTPTVAGHPMWVLTMPAEGRTIAYDCLTQQWWEPYSVNGEGFWRPLCWASAYGKQLVGDFYSSTIGVLDTKTYTEFGNPLFTEFTTQAIYSDNDRFTTRRIELIVTTGYAITPETQPKITMYISDDSGVTYYAREMDSLGLVGQRTIRCVWFNMGQSRCRVFKWRISDPTPTFAVQATGVFEGGRW